MLATAISLFVTVQRPNIVFIFTDDHARQAISAYGSKLMKTPAMDQLAREGVRFDNHYTTNPLCAPSRASILTGKFSHANGHKDNMSKFDGTQITFPKLLQQVGYDTAWIGKWHLESTPTGFNHWEILPGQGNYHNPDFITESGTKKEQGYVTDLITQKAKKWIKDEGSKPFFLMIGHKAPHRNWVPALSKLDMFADQKFVPPADFRRDYSELNSEASKVGMRVSRNMSSDKDLLVNLPPVRLTPEQKGIWKAKMDPQDAEFNRRVAGGEPKEDVTYDRYIKNYLRCVSSIDDSIAEIMTTLRALKLDKNTIVIYSSDQGFFLGEFGWFDKRWFYEPSAGTPLIVRWPGVKPGVVKGLTSNVDLAPTILDAVGATIPKEIQGVSLKQMIRDRKSDPKSVVYGHYYESRDGEHNVPKYVSLISGTKKLIYYYELDEWELFDVVKDPGEHRNLWKSVTMTSERLILAKKLIETQRRYNEEAAIMNIVQLAVSKLSAPSG